MSPPSAKEVLIALVVSFVCMGASGTGDDHKKCNSPPVREGDTGILTFFLTEKLAMSTGKLYAYVKQDDNLDVINCRRKENDRGIKCTVPDTTHYRSDGIVNTTLTLYISNVSQRDAGTYELRAFLNDVPEPTIKCNLTVENTTEDLPVDNESVDVSTIVIPILCLAVLVVAAVCCIKHRERICNYLRRAACNWKLPAAEEPDLELGDPGIPTTVRRDEPDVCGGTAQPLLTNTQPDSSLTQLPNKRWFFENLDKKVENKLLTIRGNEEGSFLIRQGVTDHNTYTLIVCNGGVLKHFTIKQEGNAFTFRDTGQPFDTLDELVEYYRKHEIMIGSSSSGRLVKPFKVKPEPEHEWYFEQITSRADEEKLLLPGTYGSGSFLIRDCISVPSDYTLTVYFKNELKHLRIVPEDRGFKLRDADSDDEIPFPTLAELVDHFREHEIKVDGESYGTLVRPFERQFEKE